MNKLLSILYIILTTGILILPFNIYPQDGHLYITNYNLSDEIAYKEIWDIEQDKYQVMFFANRRGVFSFDGIHWKFVKTPNVAYSLAVHPETNTLYAGCYNDFGYIGKNNKGIYEYYSLSKDIRDGGIISEIICNKDEILFYSENALFSLNADNLSNIKEWRSIGSNPFTGLFSFNDKIYVNIAGSGVNEVVDNNFKPLPEGSKFEEVQILFSIPFDNENILLGTTHNELFLFNGENFKPFIIEAKDYLEESILSVGIEISDDQFALATVSGGCIIVNKEDGKTFQIVNYQTGLPDDEIFSMGTDKNGGLWLSHEYGLSRIDNFIPIRKFSTYPGLVGNLNSIIDFDETYYISTSEGVFCLAEVKDYKEIEVFLKVKERIIVDEEDITEEDVKDKIFRVFSIKHRAEESQEVKDKRLRFDIIKRRDKSKTRKRKDRETDESENVKVNNIDEIKIKDEPKEKADKPKTVITRSKLVSKKIYALQSITNRYHKIEGLDEKCKQLIKYGNRLLVATNTGLYEIKDTIARPIVENVYVNCISQSINSNKFFIGTSNGLFSIRYNDDSWEIGRDFDDFDENVYSIVQDEFNNLWLGCENIAYRVTLNDNAKPLLYKHYNFETDFAEKVLVRKVGELTYFLLTSSIYAYNSIKDSIFLYRKFSNIIGGNYKHIFSQEGIIWIYYGEEWKFISSSNKHDTLISNYLQVFDNIQNIFVDEQNNIWVIERDNNLFKILPLEMASGGEFSVFIKGIADMDGTLFSLKKPKFDYENNSLEFYISAPHYLKSGTTEYQYTIEGLMKDWSRWSVLTTIELPFIPSGAYKLNVRARNILGDISEIKSIEFVIKPPFWQTLWFILICSALGLTFIVFVFYMRQRQLLRRQRILEGLVDKRTKELKIEKDKVEKLLLNVLPAKVANDLKIKGFSEPEVFDNVTVYFSDVVGFTKMSSSLEPKFVIDELNDIFTAFDIIIEKTHCERIKTIGDAYLAVCGMPVKNKNHAYNMVDASLRILEYLNDRNKVSKIEWKIRIGLHTGKVVGGVVGIKKYIYDVFGDTINTASRMESNSETMQINISETTYNLVKDRFEFIAREPLEVKGKGKMKMYFVKQ